jgi:3(or 17)beta-hydroxysteroid dehydrogenase
MSDRVAGKVAIVTGAASGIGRMSAIRLAQEGASLAITDLNVVDGQNAVQEIVDAGGEAIFVEHDVTNEDQWKSVIAAVLERFGRLDVIVNCAGISISHSVEDTPLDEWNQIMSVNADGVFLGTKYAIEAMKKNDPVGGSVINISSAYGIIGEEFNAAYCASKGAVMNFTKSAALHCGKSGYNIRVNSVHPGVVRTPMTDVEINEIVELKGYTDIDEAIEKEWAPTHPIGRIGDPIDIANGIVYLASDESSFMTGAELVIDGGMIAQ